MISPARVWCVCPKGPGKEITMSFQRYVTLNAKRHQTGSLKVMIDICQESYNLRM